MGLKHELERKEMHTTFWSENLKEKDCLEEQGIDGRIILKWVLKEVE
jgi:hypothetical protein